MGSALVTIYLPTRNRAHLLQRALGSALRQSYEHIEVIVVVDGPDPATLKLLHGFRDEPRLRVVAFDDARGACRARNEAIALARGELISGLDDDDELLEHHVAGLVRVLTEADAAFACTTAVLRRKSGDDVRHPFEGPITLDRLLEENVVGNQVLTRTAYLRELGGFDPAMPAWQDYELWIRLVSTYGPGVRVDQRSYIIHTEHDAERISNGARIRAAHDLFVAKHKGLLSERHRASLELLMYATSHQPLPLDRVAATLRAGYVRRTLEAVASDRLPFARELYRRFRASKAARF